MGSALLVLPSCRIFRSLDTSEDPGDTVPLDGGWRFCLDPENQGIRQQWYKARRFSDRVTLPGSLQAQGYGNVITAETEWWDGKLKGVWKTSPVYEKYRQPGNISCYEFLQPERHYLGVAWYSKEFTIPQGWKNKRITLLLERVHWESTVYVNGVEAGTQNYLATRHEYDVTGLLNSGRNIITIRIDNSRKIDVGDMPHSISEQTQGTWNGVVGMIGLSATGKLWIDDVQVYPVIKEKKIDSVLLVKGLLPGMVEVSVAISVSGPQGQLPVVTKKIAVTGGTGRLQVTYALGAGMALWDEHHPALYTLTAEMIAEKEGMKYAHTKTIRFGMREVAVRGTQVLINHTPAHFRGNVDCAIFPADGYPYTDIGWWRQLWLLYKEWGMNLVRFHSWCPPEAAFTAADEVGIYLQPECSEWAKDNTDAQFDFLMEESRAILERYGNHPSFIMMALGNEMSIKEAYLEKLFAVWKKDKRRLYTGKSGGKPLLDAADYYVGAASAQGTTARYYLGWPPRPEPSYFYRFRPSTTRDYTLAVEDDHRPFIAHEIGQRCSYPNIMVLAQKFTGSLQPAYLDIARDQLKERGMLDQVADFVNASGKWQVMLYKEEIEANLRTARIGGFHLLSLQDFPGQGAAPVGLMDFFYAPKSYVTSTEMRKFCNTIVVLARMEKRTWCSNEQLNGTVECYNFSGDTFKPAKTICTVKDTAGKVIHRQELPAKEYATGAVHPVGDYRIDLNGFMAAAKYTLEITMDDIMNDWDFWVYPPSPPEIASGAVVISTTFNSETEKALTAGKTVLLLPERDHLKGKLVQCFSTFYWTAFDFHGGESSSCGLLTDPEHPVFRYFPTDAHGNWQWWELLTKAAPMILDDFEAKKPFPKSYRPIVQMIPSWKVNRKLAVLTEVKAGGGKLMLCSMDITSDLENRKVAAQFKYSLLRYLLSKDFEPDTEVDFDTLEELFV